MPHLLAAVLILVAIPTLVLVGCATSRSGDEPELGALLDRVLAAGAPERALAPRRAPAGRAITVRDLLSHTAGLFDYVEDDRVLRDHERRWTPESSSRSQSRILLRGRPRAGASRTRVRTTSCSA